MNPLKVLFIGGSGTISSASAALAVARGVDLSILNRGRSARPALEGSRQLRADISDRAAVEAVLGDEQYDAVVHWVAFEPADVQASIELFRGRSKQFVFISSASAYQTPPARLPITEATPLRNPFWDYSRRKIACEDLLVQAYRSEGFPVTIVRPSHTYDPSLVPLHGGWTVIDRMRRGKEIVVHGDGTSLWTLTHHTDFAKGLVPLLGNPAAVGETFHITSDEVLTWNQIAEALAAAAGVEPRIVHVPSALIAAVDPVWGDSLLGDKAHSMVFDNSHIRSLVPEFRATVPFHQGAREITAWHDGDESRRQVNGFLEKLMDDLVERYRA